MRAWSTYSCVAIDVDILLWRLLLLSQSFDYAVVVRLSPIVLPLSLFFLLIALLIFVVVVVAVDTVQQLCDTHPNKSDKRVIRIGMRRRRSHRNVVLVIIIAVAIVDKCQSLPLPCWRRTNGKKKKEKQNKRAKASVIKNSDQIFCCSSLKSSMSTTDCP